MKDTAIFNSQLGRAPGAITLAVVQAGTPPATAQDLAAKISQSLGSGDGVAAVASLPNITPNIINIAITTLRNIQVLGFRFVWITALPFMVIATIGV